MNRREFTGGLAAAALYASTGKAFAGSPPRNVPGLSMTELQQQFLDLRFGMYIHLNMATYEQREWGDPKASPALFNPKDLDTDQWAHAAHSAGMAYGCLTTKHHDGFCLWPTKSGSANVQDATYKRDIVRAYVDSFRAQGLKTCLYFSILDLRADIRPYCVTREKIGKVKTQLTELLTNYGEITALVIDGWNAAWSRLNYEEMPFLEIYNHVKQLQPNCLMSDYNQGRYPGARAVLHRCEAVRAARGADHSAWERSAVAVRNDAAERLVLEAGLSDAGTSPGQANRGGVADPLQCAPLQSDLKRGAKPGRTLRPECGGPSC